MAEQVKSEWKEKEIGALWIKNGKQQDFLSGKIEVDGRVQQVIVFRNKGKKPENKAPDYIVYKDKAIDRSTHKKAETFPGQDLKSPIMGDAQIDMDNLPDEPPF